MTGDITTAVKNRYGAVARQGLSSDNDGIRRIAEAFGYSEDQLASIPAEANMGLSCGNPVAIASLRAGETVVDLGSGGGLDVFLAAKAVGPEGRAIGIDMTEDMVALARRNAEAHGYTNVAFHLARIEAMPLEDASVDCVISNCVLNLVEDKDAAFRDIFRILRPGGRFAISDIALKRPVPDQVRKDVAAWTACVSGAISIEENREKLATAGFNNIEIVDTSADLNAYKESAGAGCCSAGEGAQAVVGCCGTQSAEPTEAFHESLSGMIESIDLNYYAASVKIFALKPL